MRWWMAARSGAVGQPLMIRMMVCRARLMIRAGVCQSVQRSRFDSATASWPWQHRSWNQRTRPAARLNRPGFLGGSLGWVPELASGLSRW